MLVQKLHFVQYQAVYIYLCVLYLNSFEVLLLCLFAFTLLFDLNFRGKNCSLLYQNTFKNLQRIKEDIIS